MFEQLPTVLSAQQSLLSLLNRQLPSDAQQACEGAEQGIMLDELQAALKLLVAGRWIGDNVLCHLEEVEYLQQTGQPGCMVFFGLQQGI